MGALSRGSGGGGGGGTAADPEAEPEGQHRPSAILVLSGKLRGKVQRGKVSWPPVFVRHFCFTMFYHYYQRASHIKTSRTKNRVPGIPRGAIRTLFHPRAGARVRGAGAGQQSTHK